MNKKVTNIILLLIGFIVLFIFLRTVDFKDTLKTLTKTGPIIILWLFLFVNLNILLKAIRWKYLTKKVTGKDINLFFSFLSIYAGVASGCLLPGRNEVTKPLMLKSTYSIPLSKTIPAALMEKIFDFLALIIIFFLSLLLIQDNSSLKPYIIPLIVLTILILLFLFIFPKKLEKLTISLLKRFTKGNLIKFTKTCFQTFEIFKRKRSTFFLFLISLVLTSIEAVRIWYLFSAMGMAISPVIAAIAFTGGLLIGILAIIPGGIGVTELSVAFIISTFALLSLEKVKALILIDRIIAYYIVLIIGIIVMLFQNRLSQRF